MKRIAFRLGAIGAGALLAVLVLEVFLRSSGVWVGRHSDTMFSLVEHDDRLGWRMKRGFRGEVDLVDVEGIPLQSNSLGFWDDEWTVSRRDATCRVVFLGDSFTWGMGVTKEQRFSDLAARAAAWDALNFGIPGYGADQALLAWEDEAARFGPDVVILTIYQNDYSDDLHLVRYGRRKPYFVEESGKGLVLHGVPVEHVTFWQDGVFNRIAEPYALAAQQTAERRSRLAHWLVKNSDVARAVYTALRRTPPAATAADRAEAPRGLENPSPVERIQVDLLVAIVSQLRREVRAQDAELLVVLAGSPSSAHSNAAIRLEGESIPVVDATTPALADRTNGEAVYFPYSGHWTPAAHRAVATKIVDAFAAEAWCQR